MIVLDKFYIDGAWVEPVGGKTMDLIDPSTEKVVGRLSLGNEADVDRAVAAAKRAAPAFAATSVEERIALLERILAAYNSRYDEFAEAMRVEMGSPITFATKGQAARGPLHIEALLKVLRDFRFEEDMDSGTRLRHQPIGVCGLITPWNWPVNQVVVKVGPALAAGCTMVLKPSEFSAISTVLFAEVLHEAGVPAGVFNLVNGDGPTVGSAIAAHDDIAMVSFTGSTRAGIEVARAAAAASVQAVPAWQALRVQLRAQLPESQRRELDEIDRNLAALGARVREQAAAVPPTGAAAR